MFDIKNYYEAKNLEEALSYLEKESNPLIISGGTDVLVKARDRKENYTSMTLVGITRIPELSDIYLDEEENLVIGAVNSFNTIEKNELVKKHAPLLAYAVSTVGGPQTRSMGTIGGNVCNGATSADSAPTLFAYNAILEIHDLWLYLMIPFMLFLWWFGLTRVKYAHVFAMRQIRKRTQ